jgi:hypothetical protein
MSIMIESPDRAEPGCKFLKTYILRSSAIRVPITSDKGRQAHRLPSAGFATLAVRRDFLEWLQTAPMAIGGLAL